jgi:polyhydroxyalkanoate synthase
MMLAPTPKDVICTDAGASLYRFRGPVAPKAGAPPVLLVPSMINRWYVLDLRAGASLAGALVELGLDVWCLDWGIPHDEDRYLEWDDVVRRLSRMARRVRRETGAERLSLLGYCMGATVGGIYTALEPQGVDRFVNLLGPFDFSHAGFLGLVADRRWFDADLVAEAGNVAPQQMQAGFVMLRPTAALAKWVGVLERGMDEGFKALEAWASDNIAFPAAAYRRYIRELYQENRLVTGGHRVHGREVRLSDIACPVLTIAASRDAICPKEAALGLNRAVKNAELLEVPGGHVGAVVGSAAARSLYPALGRFFSASA